MLIPVTHEAVAGLRRAMDCLEAIEAGSLVEITRQGDRVEVVQITGPNGAATDTVDEVFVAAFPLASS